MDKKINWKTGYSVNLSNGERECFRELGELTDWLRKNEQTLKGSLISGSVVLTEEDFDEELWEELDYTGKEICCECGESVGAGSEKAVNRIPSFSNYKERKDGGMLYPEGAYICEECDKAAERGDGEYFDRLRFIVRYLSEIAEARAEEYKRPPFMEKARQEFIDWVDVEVIADEFVFEALNQCGKKMTASNAKKVWNELLGLIGLNIDEWVENNKRIMELE